MSEPNNPDGLNARLEALLAGARPMMPNIGGAHPSGLTPPKISVIPPGSPVDSSPEMPIQIVPPQQSCGPDEMRTWPPDHLLDADCLCQPTLTQRADGEWLLTHNQWPTERPKHV